jgi:DNA-binding IclR family transcriptional regulator
MTNDPSQIVGELIFGRWRSQILYAGVKLGVFDALGESSKTSSDIAEVLRLDSALTYRLLRALASLGLLHEDADRSFALTACGEYLRADHPQTMRGVALLEKRAQSITRRGNTCVTSCAMANRMGLSVSLAIRYSCMSWRMQTTGLCSTRR